MIPVHPGGRARAALPLVALAGAALAAAASCSSDGSTGPEGVVAIAFDTLPAPAVVRGDTLRDAATGQVAPLAARAYDRRDAIIPGAPFTYFSPDTTHAVRIAAGNLVVAEDKGVKDTVVVVAAIGKLQLARGLFVVPRPDRIAGPDSVKAKALAQTDTSINVSNVATVRVVHETTSADSLVRGWVVRFRLGSHLAPRLADSVRLSDASGNAKTVDTTKAADGTASIYVRVFAKPSRAKEPIVSDTVEVLAEAMYRGQPLANSPVTLYVPVFGVVP